MYVVLSVVCSHFCLKLFDNSGWIEQSVGSDASSNGNIDDNDKNHDCRNRNNRNNSIPGNL